MQLTYFRRTIYYDTIQYGTADARSDLDRTVQRQPTKAYNAKVENAHVYLVHSLSSNYVEICVRNYVISFSTLHMISLFWNNVPCNYKKEEKSIPLSVLQAV
jgi:hypothetical protein